MSNRKPSCYLQKVRSGYFMLDYLYHWEARDNWDHLIATGRTKKECMKEAREAGYTPR